MGFFETYLGKGQGNPFRVEFLLSQGIVTLFNVKRRVFTLFVYVGFCSLFCPESIATLPPFGLIEGQKWVFQISSK